MSKIFIVKVHGGEWENSVKAFSTREKAEAYKKELEDNKPEYSEYLDRLIGRIYEFAHMYALRVPAEEYYEELDYIGDILRQKAYKKYPCYTEDIDEANYWYSVEEVEMEE